jgi:hypothetical protein
VIPARPTTFSLRAPAGLGGFRLRAAPRAGRLRRRIPELISSPEVAKISCRAHTFDWGSGVDFD